MHKSHKLYCKHYHKVQLGKKICSRYNKGLIKKGKVGKGTKDMKRIYRRKNSNWSINILKDAYSKFDLTKLKLWYICTVEYYLAIKKWQWSIDSCNNVGQSPENYSECKKLIPKVIHFTIPFMEHFFFFTVMEIQFTYHMFYQKLYRQFSGFQYVHRVLEPSSQSNLRTVLHSQKKFCAY